MGQCSAGSLEVDASDGGRKHAVEQRVRSEDCVSNRVDVHAAGRRADPSKLLQLGLRGWQVRTRGQGWKKELVNDIDIGATGRNTYGVKGTAPEWGR